MLFLMESMHACFVSALDLATQTAAFAPERRHSISVCESPTKGKVAPSLSVPQLHDQNVLISTSSSTVSYVSSTNTSDLSADFSSALKPLFISDVTTSSSSSDAADGGGEKNEETKDTLMRLASGCYGGGRHGNSSLGNSCHQQYRECNCQIIHANKNCMQGCDWFPISPNPVSTNSLKN